MFPPLHKCHVPVPKHSYCLYIGSWQKKKELTKEENLPGLISIVTAITGTYQKEARIDLSDHVLKENGVMRELRDAMIGLALANLADHHFHNVQLSTRGQVQGTPSFLQMICFSGWVKSNGIDYALASLSCHVTVA